MNKYVDKYKLLKENMMDGYAYHQIVKNSTGDPVDYIFLDVNQVFEDITGLSKDEILNKKATEVLPGIEKYGFDWICKYGEVASTGKPVRFENYSNYLNRWYEVSAYSLEQDFFIAIFRDITRQKRADETLAISEMRYRRLFESAKDGILILDANTGQIIDANPFIVNLLGYADNEMLGKMIWEIGTFKDVIANLQNFIELQKEEFIRYEDLPLQSQNGKQVSVEFISNVYTEGNNKVIQCNIRDITERKVVEELTRKRLSELEAIYTISAALRTANTLDEMLTLLLNEILRVLDTSAGAICLYNCTNEQLQFTTTQGWFRGLDNAFLKSVDSIVGKVFTSKEALIFEDYSVDASLKYIGKIPEKWGGVCVPLKADQDVVGTLLVSVVQPRVITSQELKLLTSLAEIASTAIHRIRLFDKNIRHIEQLQALRNIDMAISGNLDLRVTYRVILDEVARLLNVDAAAILRINSHTGLLKYEAWRGFRHTSTAKLNLSIGEGLAGQAALSRKTVQAASRSDFQNDLVQGPHLEKEEAEIYYAIPLINKGRIEGVLEIFHREPLNESEEWLEFLETLAGQTALAIDNAELVHNLANTNFKLIQSYDNTIKGWAHALDLRDKETEDHSQRVMEMTIGIAQKMGMNEEELAHVRRGALLHDIGKMGIPDAILLKPGPLTEEEWKVMRMHPVYAFEMLSSIEYLRHALDIPYCHHEKWDGTGYPRGLKNEEIPLAARIFAIVDVYDALTSDRPYRKAWSKETALEYIRMESGVHFDPKLVDMFFKELQK
ncbi:MAG: GAF domain-containing protein [Erysipelotrichaceae bacterium]|nr:GAF domain-containing protein [Erysipelotrichaceae bacterium]